MNRPKYLINGAAKIHFTQLHLNSLGLVAFRKSSVYLKWGVTEFIKIITAKLFKNTLNINLLYFVTEEVFALSSICNKIHQNAKSISMSVKYL